MREYTLERRPLTYALPLRQWFRTEEALVDGKMKWLWSSREWTPEAKAAAMREHTCLKVAK